MPHFQIRTNVPKSSIPSTFLKETSTLIANMLGKPEGYCVVTAIPDQMMMFGGEDGPCAMAILMSIGKLGLSENKKYSKILSDHVEKHLGVSPSRMYIEFHDTPSSQVGYRGTTFHELLG